MENKDERIYYSQDGIRHLWNDDNGSHSEIVSMEVADKIKARFFNYQTVFGYCGEKTIWSV